MRSVTVLFAALLFAAFVLRAESISQVASGDSQAAAPVISTEEQLKEDLVLVPCLESERTTGVRGLFQKMGAPADAVASVKLEGTENLVVKVPGRSAGTIVIGAHYDFIKKGCGAIDNWSGIVAIAHLYRSIRSQPFQKTVLFVAFGKEEDGLVGSKAMTKAIAKDDVPGYCAMINIDSLGMGVPFALKGATSPSMLALAKKSAESMQMPFYQAAIDIADADSSSFIRKKIPAVTLSALDDKWQTILHTSEDQSSRVNSISMYLGYRLALLMSNTIDKLPCDAYR